MSLMLITRNIVGFDSMLSAFYGLPMENSIKPLHGNMGLSRGREERV